MPLRSDFIISTIRRTPDNLAYLDWVGAKDGLEYSLEVSRPKRLPPQDLYKRFGPHGDLRDVLLQLRTDVTIDSKLTVQYRPPGYYNSIPDMPPSTPPGVPFESAFGNMQESIDWSAPYNVSKISFTNGKEVDFLVNDALHDSQSPDGKGHGFVPMQRDFSLNKWYNMIARPRDMSQTHPEKQNISWHPYVPPR
jgi:hypothetical protein